jgi:hypothetical protein
VEHRRGTTSVVCRPEAYSQRVWASKLRLAVIRVGWLDDKVPLPAGLFVSQGSTWNPGQDPTRVGGGEAEY